MTDRREEIARIVDPVAYDCEGKWIDTLFTKERRIDALAKADAILALGPVSAVPTPSEVGEGKIMYVCEICAKENPESCGRFDPTEIRVATNGRWLCESCYDDSGEGDPQWLDRPAASLAAPALIAEEHKPTHSTNSNPSKHSTSE